MKLNLVCLCMNFQVLFILGWRILMRVFCVVSGTVDWCASILSQGHLLAVAPGGVREAQFSDHYYQLLWGQRVGFSKVALKANVVSISF